jgi:hypothetical protein
MNMATYRINIDLGNDAFQDGNEGAEVATILRDLAKHCERECNADSRMLQDTNGNGVGSATRK